MRFTQSKTIHIKKLDLDEHNYRFISAEDQGEAISKIYSSNPKNFKNMMRSIAEVDLDQPVLVLVNSDGANIVADGNRRIAALKVLHNPELAPNPSVKTLSKKLIEDFKFDSFKIDTQYSSNEELVLLTVYERHAAGKGVSSIPWDAFGAALFRYDNYYSDSDTNEWHSIALITELFHQFPELTDIRLNKQYSHDVFRRLVRAAETENIIATDLFNEKEQRLKQTPKKRLNDTLEIARTFVEDIKTRKISLSRNKEATYADKENIGNYLEKFRNTKPKGASSGKSNTTDSNSTTSTSPKPSKAKKPNISERISHSQSIEDSLIQLKNNKLSRLYYSLCNVSAKDHPILIDVGSWSFLESLSRLAGMNEKTDFENFLEGRINIWFPTNKDKTLKKDMKGAIKYFLKHGNASKHSPKNYNPNYEEIIKEFDLLTPCLLQLIQKAKGNS